MILELVKHEGKSVGWKLVAENEADRLRLGSVRNLQFWGFDDTNIEYAGVNAHPEYENQVQSLEWRQHQHLNTDLKP